MKRLKSVLKLHKEHPDLVPVPIWKTIGTVVGVYVLLDLVAAIWERFLSPLSTYVAARAPGWWAKIRKEALGTFDDPKERRLFGHMHFWSWIGLSYAGALAYTVLGVCIFCLGVLFAPRNGLVGVFEVAGLVVVSMGFVRFFVAQSGQAELAYADWRDSL